MIPGNANWNAAADADDQAPVYYLAVSGISGEHYSTAAVKSAGTTKVLILGTPIARPTQVDLLDGKSTVGRVDIPILDVAGKATDLVGVDRVGALVATWKNRKCTVYAGYRSIAEADYIPVFVGRVVGLHAAGGMTGYVLELEDTSARLAAPIMVNADDDHPTTVRGNVVNVFASILRNVFSTTDPDFPLEVVSSASGSTSAPSGIGIADADLDIAGMKAQRDVWRPDDRVELVVSKPLDGESYLETEFFRAFQAQLRISGAGLLGFRWNVPALPASSAGVLDLGTSIELLGWRHVFRDHLNKFRVRGDHDPVEDAYSDLYASDTAEDTADRTATGETVEYLVESKWLRGALDGREIARELAGRLRQTYLRSPTITELALSFRQRRIEIGDVLSVTHPRIPNLSTGALGVVSRMMTCVGFGVDYAGGRIVVELQDAGLRRYGVISPSSKTGDYSGASAADRLTYFFISNSSGQISGEDGYRFI